MNWKCTVCNLIRQGESPPEKCPKCGVPGSKYVQMSKEEWDLVERSRYTNALHIELLTIFPRLIEIAKKGLEDNLDPRCVDLFAHLLKEASFLESSTKAEIEGHMKKGKWG
ncbi:MAG: rubredoxin-like domain-containing protein [bacterium]|jgi:rubredoxin